MFTTNSDLEIGTGFAAAFGTHANKLAYAFAVQRRERILLEDAFCQIRGQHLVDVVAREAERGLSEVVGAKGEELGLLRDLVSHQGGAGEFDHGPDHVVHAAFLFRENFFGNAIDDRGLVRHLFQGGGKRNHDLGEYFHAVFRDCYRGLENRTRLHFGDLGIGDTETATTVSQHGVELVQFFHAAQQSGDDFLQVTNALSAEPAISLDQRLLLFRVGVGKNRDVYHQIFASRQELVQRRIESADRNREAVHSAKDADKIRSLHR